MTRNTLIFCASLLALCGSIVSALATINDRDYQLRGYVDPTRNENLPFRLPLLGVNADLTLYEADELIQQLELMREANIHWVRQEFRWDEIELTDNEYSWEIWDNILEAINQFDDLQLVAVLINSPEWARHINGESQTAPPQNPETFADFATEFTQRYGESIDYYQIWDEPNLAVGWGELPPNPIQYTALLQAGYTAIHSNDARATVITAGIAPTSTTVSDLTVNDFEYLEALYDYGANAYFDAVAGKPYGYERPPDDHTIENDILNFSRIIHLREIMVAHGDGQKALWASHWGWNTVPSVWGQVTIDQQVNYTLGSLNRAEREWTWMGGMILQNWQPDATADHPLWGFALRDPNNQPTALFNALTTREVPNYAINGLYAAQNAYTRYSGIWTFGELGADIGWVDDSQLSFNFFGSDVALLLRQDNYVAYLYPTIDDEQANATPLDPDGNAYVVLTSDTLQPEISLVAVGHNLSKSTHELHIVTDELIPQDAQDRWAIVGFAVSSGNLAHPYNQQISIAWFTALVAGISALITGSQVNWMPLYSSTKRLWRPLNSVTQLGLGVIASIALMIGLLLTWGESTPHVFRRDSVQLGIAILTAGILRLEIHFIVVIASAVVLFLIFFNHIEIGLTLTIFWCPFFLFPVELYQFAFPMAEVMLWLTVGAWILRLLAELSKMKHATSHEYKRPTLKLNTMDYLIVAWVVLGILSLVWTERVSLATTELRTLIIQPALFYTLVRTSTLSKKHLLQLVDALILAGFVVALVGIIQFVQGDAIITAEDGARRLAGVYGSPNNIGLFLGRCIPFALAFTLSGLDMRRRILSGAMLVVMGVAVVLSQSVGALFIGIPVSIICVLILVYRKRSLLPIIGLITLGIVALMFAIQQPRFSRAFTFTEGTNFYRLRVWESSLQIIEDHPITGIGLDQFLYEYRGQYIIPDAWEEPSLSHPHNIILDFWTRLGMMGVVLIIIIQITFWGNSFRLYHQFWHTPSLHLSISIGILGCMADILAHGLVDNSIFVLDLAYVFMFVLALPVNLPNTSAIDDKPQLMV